MGSESDLNNPLTEAFSVNRFAGHVERAGNNLVGGARCGKAGCLFLALKMSQHPADSVLHLGHVAIGVVLLQSA